MVPDVQAARPSPRPVVRLFSVPGAPPVLGVDMEQVALPSCLLNDAGLRIRLWFHLSDIAVDGVAQASLTALARDLEATVRGIQKALDGLEVREAIVREPWPGAVNRYLLVGGKGHGRKVVLDGRLVSGIT